MTLSGSWTIILVLMTAAVTVMIAVAALQMVTAQEGGEEKDSERLDICAYDTSLP